MKTRTTHQPATRLVLTPRGETVRDVTRLFCVSVFYGVVVSGLIGAFVLFVRFAYNLSA